MMTGKEFEVAMKRLGLTQTGLAQILGCDRGTIAARCKAREVDTQYRYAMLGMLAEQAAKDLAPAVNWERGEIAVGRKAGDEEARLYYIRLGMLTEKDAKSLVSVVGDSQKDQISTKDQSGA